MGWNWRAFIPLKERYDLDGREIVIVNKTSTDFSRLRDIILLVCKTERMAQHFPKLKFVITPTKNNPQVNPSELAAGKTVIELGGKIIDQDFPKFKEEWNGIITHELTHLYHNYRSGIIITFRKISGRLKKTLSPIVTSIELVNLVSMRGILFRFSKSLFTEGVARYNEILSYGDILFSEELFEQKYEVASEKVNAKTELFIMTLGPLKKRNTKKSKVDECLSTLDGFFHGLCYFAGYHMVYTILFVDHNTTFEDILHFQPFEFIKKYEECMKIKGLQPVVSATSGKGIFDYKKMLVELTVAVKEVQKKSA